jgi:hypothetical protein
MKQSGARKEVSNTVQCGGPSLEAAADRNHSDGESTMAQSVTITSGQGAIALYLHVPLLSLTYGGQCNCLRLHGGRGSSFPATRTIPSTTRIFNANTGCNGLGGSSASFSLSLPFSNVGLMLALASLTYVKSVLLGFASFLLVRSLSKQCYVDLYNNNRLYEWAKRLDFHQKAKRNRNPMETLSAASIRLLQSFVGAHFEESGFSKVQSFVFGYFQECLNAPDITPPHRLEPLKMRKKAIASKSSIWAILFIEILTGL